jgi:hypothetical protein
LNYYVSLIILTEVTTVLPDADLALAGFLLDVEPLASFIGDLFVLTRSQSSEATLDQASINRLAPVLLTLGREEDNL